MKKLFALADRYLQESDWKTMAMLKFCLLGLGIAVGAMVPPKYKKTAVAVGLCTCQAKVDTEKQFRGSPVQTCTERGFYSPKRRQVDHD